MGNSNKKPKQPQQTVQNPYVLYLVSTEMRSEAPDSCKDNISGLLQIVLDVDSNGITFSELNKDIDAQDGFRDLLKETGFPEHQVELQTWED